MPGHDMVEILTKANVFDERFTPLSYLADGQDRLQAIDLSVRSPELDQPSYVLSVETVGTHMARVALDESEADEGDAQTYVIAGDEILPSDLVAIKLRPISEMMPYLLIQEPEA